MATKPDNIALLHFGVRLGEYLERCAARWHEANWNAKSGGMMDLKKVAELCGEYYCELVEVIWEDAPPNPPSP